MTQTNSQIREEWREEFDGRFGILWGRKNSTTFGTFDEDPARFVIIDSNEVKSFIAELLKSHREELVEKIRELIAYIELSKTQKVEMAGNIIIKQDK